MGGYRERLYPSSSLSISPAATSFYLLLLPASHRIGHKFFLLVFFWEHCQILAFLVLPREGGRESERSGLVRMPSAGRDGWEFDVGF